MVLIPLQTMPAGGGGGVSDHGAPTGRDQEDHSKYGPLAQANAWAALQTFNAGLRLAASQVIEDSGATGRILLAPTSPNITLTGAVRMATQLGNYIGPTAHATSGLNIEPSGVITANTNAIRLAPGFTYGANGIQIVGVAGNAFFNGSTGFTALKAYGLDFIAVGLGGATPGSTFTELIGAQSQIGKFGNSFMTINDITAFKAKHALFFQTPGTTITRESGFHSAIPGISVATNVYHFRGDALTAGTNRYGLFLGAIAGGTIARLLELGTGPELRLLGRGEWTPAPNETPLYLAEGATPTLRQIKQKAGNTLVAGDKVMVLV